MRPYRALLQYACQQMDRASTQLPTIRFVGVYTHSDRGTYIRTIHGDAAQPYVRLTIVCALVQAITGVVTVAMTSWYELDWRACAGGRIMPGNGVRRDCRHTAGCTPPQRIRSMFPSTGSAGGRDTTIIAATAAHDATVIGNIRATGHSIADYGGRQCQLRHRPLPDRCRVHQTSSMRIMRALPDSPPTSLHGDRQHPPIAAPLLAQYPIPAHPTVTCPPHVVSNVLEPMPLTSSS